MSELEHIKPVIKRVVEDFRLMADQKPKHFVPKEYEEQCTIFDYIRVRAKQDPRWGLIFATLNGIRLPIGLAVKAKRAGMNAGITDIVVPIIGWQLCPGLFMELKRLKGGRVEEWQEVYHNLLRHQGYCVVVKRGSKAAIDSLELYMSGRGLPE